MQLVRIPRREDLEKRCCISSLDARVVVIRVAGSSTFGRSHLTHQNFYLQKELFIAMLHN